MKKYNGKVNLEELEQYCLTHSKKEVQKEYGQNGVHLMYKFRFQHPYKYRTKEVKTLEIMEKLRKGARQCDLARSYGYTRQRISQIASQIN